MIKTFTYIWLIFGVLVFSMEVGLSNAQTNDNFDKLKTQLGDLFKKFSGQQDIQTPENFQKRSPVGASDTSSKEKPTINGKGLYCLNEDENLWRLNQIGERYFYFHEGYVVELLVEESDPPDVSVTVAVPYKSLKNVYQFDRHYLYRKSLKLLSPNSNMYNCKVLYGGMNGPGSVMEMVKDRLMRINEEIGENKI
jgi:hypothetical protein